MNFDPSKLRIGTGHDTHRLGDGGPLRIGGVDIEFDHHLIGHSDADVLLHAITDALMGAASLGDIGTVFPNDLEENKDRSSIEMLQIISQKIADAGYQVINIDCVVFAERPKLAGYRNQMKTNIGQAMNLAPDRIGLKSKTGEGVDAVGNGQAISAQCVALLTLKN